MDSADSTSRKGEAGDSGEVAINHKNRVLDNEGGNAAPPTRKASSWEGCRILSARLHNSLGNQPRDTQAHARSAPEVRTPGEEVRGWGGLSLSSCLSSWPAGPPHSPRASPGTAPARSTSATGWATRQLQSHLQSRPATKRERGASPATKNAQARQCVSRECVTARRAACGKRIWGQNATLLEGMNIVLAR